MDASQEAYGFAYSALACFRMGCQVHQTELQGYSTTPLKAQRSPPCGLKRSNNTHFPSGDHTG
jgi:hypothetical protein